MIRYQPKTRPREVIGFTRDPVIPLSLGDLLSTDWATCLPLWRSSIGRFGTEPPTPGMNSNISPVVDPGSDVILIVGWQSLKNPDLL
jgi:hypothetical protein